MTLPTASVIPCVVLIETLPPLMNPSPAVLLRSNIVLVHNPLVSMLPVASSVTPAVPAAVKSVVEAPPVIVRRLVMDTAPA